MKLLFAGRVLACLVVCCPVPSPGQASPMGAEISQFPSRMRGTTEGLGGTPGLGSVPFGEEPQPLRRAERTRRHRRRGERMGEPPGARIAGRKGVVH